MDKKKRLLVIFLKGKVCQKWLPRKIIHLEAIDDLVFRHRRWGCLVGMPEFYGVRDNLALGVTLYQLETLVQVEGGADVESVFGPVIP